MLIRTKGFYRCITDEKEVGIVRKAGNKFRAMKWGFGPNEFDTLKAAENWLLS